MTGTRIVVDSLWCCLCPSVDKASLLRAIHRPSPRMPRRPLQPGYRSSCGRSAGPGTTRKVHTGAAARVGRVGLIPNAAHGGPGTDGTDGAGRAESAEEAERRRADELPWVRSLLVARPPFRTELEGAPTAAIYAALRRLQYAPAAYDRINAFVRFLVEERHEKLTAMLCEVLVRANCHTSGSAETVADVLQALSEGGITPTPGLYHGALAALAVHPDYLLRNAVLAEMKARWIDLAPEGRHNVALGLLRDGQFERALDLLEALTADGSGGIAVPPWLLDVFVYVLAQAGFLDDALRIVNHRLLRDDEDEDTSRSGHSHNHTAISLTMWHFLLDASCRHGHYDGLCFVWRRAVRPGRLTPSDATGLAVLNMAARHGDATLAAEAMQLLSARGSKLSMPHFEAMLDCYAAAAAFGHALQALCIMDRAGVPPDEGSTRAIYLGLTAATQKKAQNAQKAKEALRRKQEAVGGAVTTLLELKAKYGSVPLAAFDVVLEAMLHAADDRAIEAALNLYRHVRQLCPDGPGRSTFRLLFRGCADVPHLNFLASEMRAFGLPPDMEMVNKLVYENAEHGSLDLAVKHVLDLVGDGDDGASDGASDTDTTAITTADAARLRARPWISRRAATALARRCVEEEDARIWQIADASRARGRSMDAILRDVLQDMSPERRTAYGVPRAIGLETDEPADISPPGS